MCMSAPKMPPAPIQQAPRQVVSQAVESQDRPIELVTADKDVKKKKSPYLLFQELKMPIPQ